LVRSARAEGVAARDHLVHAAEFYTATGCRDLMFHPCECSFTLLELAALLDGAGLDLVGMWFQSLDADRRARSAYNQSLHLTPVPLDGLVQPPDRPDKQVNLQRWHSLEGGDPSLFGRMHVLFAQKRMTVSGGG